MAVTLASVPAVPGGSLVEHQAFEMNVTLVTLSVGGADSVTWCWCRQSARTWPRTSASTGGYRCGQTRAISTSLGRRCLRAQQQLRWSVQLASGLSVARNAQRRARSSRWSRTCPCALKELRRPRHGRRSLQPVHVTMPVQHVAPQLRIHRAAPSSLTCAGPALLALQPSHPSSFHAPPPPPPDRWEHA